MTDKAMKFSPLRSAEAIYQDLLKNRSDVSVDARKATEIWLIFRRTRIAVGQVESFENRAFLQAALMSAIEGSFAMGWVETIFRSAYKPTASVQGIIKSLAKKALKIYYRNWKNESPELYQSVIDTIAYSHKPYFDMIESGLDI